nr:YIP1 family protein [Paenibacillus sp. 7541]
MIMLVGWPLDAYAQDAYKTYTISVDGEPIETQTAYAAIGVISDPSLQQPEDVYIDEHNRMYIADSGSKQIIILDESREVVKAVGQEVLQKPTGVAVGPEGKIYVADSGKIYAFSKDGELLAAFGKPESPLFGKNQIFQPSKLAVDIRENLYVIGEGATNGIIQLNKDGEFAGYFGANTTQTSFFQAFRNLITANSGIKTGFMNVPIAPTNIDIDDRGIVYTVTNGLESQAVKKLNVAGRNMLPSSMFNPELTIDIEVGNQGNFYVLSSRGNVYEYDSTGNVLFIFGSQASDSQRLGILKEPSSIAVDPQGKIYLTDKSQGLIHTLEPTEFTDLVHQGLAYYEEGLYVQSEQYWKQVLQLNSSFALAHIAMGEAYYKQLQYAEALKSFEMANHVVGYSQAFWEIRYNWIEAHIGQMMVGLILAFIAWRALKYADKRTDCLRGIRAVWKKIRSVRLIHELLLLFKMLRHPLDTFYDIKNGNKASVLSASILYIVFFVEYMLSLGYTGFIFSTGLLENISLLLIIAIFVSVLALFIIVNYLISTITDGEGSFKQVYISSIYSLAPYLIFILPITLLSRVLTINEAFLYDFSLQIIIVWSVLNLCIMVKEIHNYTISETIKNILLTLFGSIITVTVLIIVYILLGQVYEFIYSLIQEVTIRV